MSPEPLFTVAADAKLPFPAGSYQDERFENGTWQKIDGPITTLEVTADRSYRLAGQSSPSIRFFELGTRFIVQVDADTRGAQYMLAEISNGRPTFFEPDCNEFSKLPAFRSNGPDEIDSGTCVFKSREKLLPALIAYGATARPTRRLSPVSAESAAQAAATASVASNTTRMAESPLFELSVCNKSKTVARYMAFYRHPQDAAKWLLKGWWKVEQDKCVSIRIPRGYFYVSAHGEDGSVWAGADRHLCISDRVTERVVFENEKCLVGETNRGFHERFNVQDKYTFNLDP